jgi:Glycosyl hydrolase family 9
MFETLPTHVTTTKRAFFSLQFALPLAVSLSLTTQIWVAPIASAESILVPRLGFSSYQDKRVKIVRTPAPVAETNSATPEVTPSTSPDSETGLREDERAASEPVSTETPAENPEQPPELTKEEKAAQKTAEKEAKRLKEEAEKKAKDEARAQRRAEKDAKRALKKGKKDAVAGEMYLYSIKNKRILYHTQASAVLPDAKRTVSRVRGDIDTVEFKAPVSEGLYTVAVQGSGHITKVPMWVSDSIYWEAMRPVIRDLGQNHCPSQKGKFTALQYCYALKIANENASPSSLVFEDRYVKGGWFTDSYNQTDTSFHKKAKDTAEIAQITNLLLNLYALNPESYKYLELEGIAYKETQNPDVLDEVNWGLQYLQTAQNPNGALPEGIEQPFEFRQEYQLLPDSSDATALAISALTQGANMYKDENLNYSVSLIISAEKAWAYLSQHPASSAYQFLAAATLADATGKGTYQAEADRLASHWASLPENLKVMLGRRWNQSLATGATDTSANTLTASVSTEALLPEAASKQEVNINQVAAELELRPSVNNVNWGARQIETLYGYEPVKFEPEINFKLDSAWRDPLAYIAYKAGERITKMSYKLEDKKVTSRDSKDLPSEFLKELEEKEATAKNWMNKGYKQLTLSPLNKAYLAYSLGLLNEKMALWQDTKDPKRKDKDAKNSQPSLEDVETMTPSEVEEAQPAGETIEASGQHGEPSEASPLNTPPIE